MAGVYPSGNKFRAFLGRKGKRIYLGTFDSEEAAQAAYDKAKQEPTMTAPDTFERSFRIDPKIQDLLPPCTVEEYSLLEENILAGKHVDAIVVLVIAGDRVLGDGHNRLKICETHGITYGVRYVTVASWDEALLWVINNQFGRRNLTPERRAYYRGKEYLLKKKAVGRPVVDPNLDTVSKLGSDAPSPAEEMAEKYGVNEKTIRRDADFAEAVDKVTEDEGLNAGEKILSGDSGKTREEIIQSTKPPPTHERRKRVHVNGSEVFKLSAVKEHIGQIGRELDRLCDEYNLRDSRGACSSREYTGIHRKLLEVQNDVETWHKSLLRTKGRAG